MLPRDRFLLTLKHVSWSPVDNCSAFRLHRFPAREPSHHRFCYPMYYKLCFRSREPSHHRFCYPMYYKLCSRSFKATHGVKVLLHVPPVITYRNHDLHDPILVAGDVHERVGHELNSRYCRRRDGLSQRVARQLKTEADIAQRIE